MLSAYFTTQIYAFMQIVMSCFSYGGEDTRRLIALAFCVDPQTSPHTQHTHTKTKTPHTHTPLGHKKKKGGPHQGTPTHKKIAAAIYSPTPTKMQYHQHHRA